MLDKEVLKTVSRIELSVRGTLDTVMTGAYHSSFKGNGMEFSEVREYMPGDDVRTIDWNVTARTGTPFLTYLNENLCVDTSRVFSSGFSFGAMYSNSLAQTFQHRLRGVVVFATADQVIYLPKNAGKPIAWMGTVGLSDGTCPPSMGRSARDRILKNNGPEGHTDCTGEKATEFSGGNHVCYDYKTVDPTSDKRTASNPPRLPS